MLVCDGASSYVSALKATCGVSGAYGAHTSSSNKRSGGPSSDKYDSEPSTDKHEVKPWFAHPDGKIFCVICPSHQVSLHNALKYFVIHYCNFFKNMINALHSLRENGTKAFTHKVCTSG